MVSGTAEPTGPRRSEHALPRWFETPLAWALCALLGTQIAGVGLAMVGRYEPIPVAVASLALTVALVRLWHAGDRKAGHGENGRPKVARSAVGATVVVLVVVGGMTATNARYASQHLRTNRDAGTYNVVGGMMAREGDLLFETREGPFADHPELGHTGFAFYDTRDDNRVYAQFPHALPALLGIGWWLGGTDLMVRVAPLLGGLGLLALFAFATRLVRPWIAALVVSTLAVNLVQVWFSRDSYSELPSQFVVFAGLWLLWEARRSRDAPRALLAGLVLGSTAMLRVDAYVLLTALIVYGAAEWIHGAGHPDHRRFVAAFGAGVATTAALGYLDVAAFSPVYLSDLGSQISRVRLLVAATAAGTGLVLWQRHRLAPLGQRLWRHRQTMATVTAVAIVILAGYAYFLRPAVEYQTADPNALVEGIQARDGLEVDGTRSYGEFTMVWLNWYLGPVALAAGVVGIALLARRALARSDLRLLPFLGVFAVGAALYVWRPSITPDHPWAMRRYLPIAVPGILLGAGVVAEWLVARPRDRSFLRLGAVAILATGLVYAAAVTWPLREVRAEVPGLAVTDRLCAEVGERGAVLILHGSNLENSLPQAVRAFCDVPVARVDPGVGLAFVEELRDEWARAGRTLRLVHADPQPFGAVARLDPVTIIDAEIDLFEVTLDRRPDRILKTPSRLYVTTP